MRYAECFCWENLFSLAGEFVAEADGGFDADGHVVQLCIAAAGIRSRKGERDVLCRKGYAKQREERKRKQSPKLIH